MSFWMSFGMRNMVKAQMLRSRLSGLSMPTDSLGDVFGPEDNMTRFSDSLEFQKQGDIRSILNTKVKINMKIVYVVISYRVVVDGRGCWVARGNSKPGPCTPRPSPSLTHDPPSTIQLYALCVFLFYGLDLVFQCPPWGVIRKYGTSRCNHRRDPKVVRGAQVKE